MKINEMKKKDVAINDFVAGLVSMLAEKEAKRIGFEWDEDSIVPLIMMTIEDEYHITENVTFQYAMDSIKEACQKWAEDTKNNYPDQCANV
jgi:hypothetical protein